MKSFLLVSVFLLMAALSTAQVSSPSSGTNSVVAASQAPDDVLAKLASLIHAGKYPEAQQLTAGLLLAYPDDQRLVKAKTLLDKLVAAQMPAPAPAPVPPAGTVAPSPQPASPAAQPTGMDLVEYNTLTELGREAQQTTDLDQQKQLLLQFMDQSGPFLQKYPDLMLLWQLRAASAITLGDPMAGYEAGQKLLASGQADTDPNTQRLLAQLNLKGWLDMKKIQEEQQRKITTTEFGSFLGTWDVDWVWKPYLITDRLCGNRGEENFAIAGTNIVGYQINSLGKISEEPDLRGVFLASGEIRWECYLPRHAKDSNLFQFHREVVPFIGNPADPDLIALGHVGDSDFYPYGWQPVLHYSMQPFTASTGHAVQRRTRPRHLSGESDGQWTIAVPSQGKEPGSDLSKSPVTLIFTKPPNGEDQQESQPKLRPMF